VGKENQPSAITQFEEAIKLKSDFAEAHYNLALLLLRQGQTERSAEEFKKAQELNPLLKPPADSK
jgi:tetratricopeptide (TPR) repeat protein